MQTMQNPIIAELKSPPLLLNNMSDDDYKKEFSLALMDIFGQVQILDVTMYAKHYYYYYYFAKQSITKITIIII